MAAALLASACGGVAPSPAALTYRQFSASPSLGNGAGSPDPRDEAYGALSVFIQRATDGTRALGADQGVAFTLSAGAPTLADVANDVYSAAYFAGGSLNPVWGFAYNSVPFGPDFARMVEFLYDGGGVELANRILAERSVDVVAFPVVGSPAQMSGYFMKPVGAPECAEGDDDCASFGEGIGLEGMCGEEWTLRYLPPAETIVDLACDEFAGPQRLGFIQAVPGGAALLTSIQQGAVHGLEFATPLDDFDAAKGGFFANADAPTGSDGRNLGEVGPRFAHYPAWHQPFYVGWMVVNRSRVWDRLTPGQQSAIEEAAREALVESFRASSSLQCEYLGRILALNDGRSQRGPGAGSATGASADMVPTMWRAEDLDRLRAATLRFLEGAAGGGEPSPDQADYATVITAMHRHLGHASVAEMLDAWTNPGEPVPGGCAG